MKRILIAIGVVTLIAPMVALAADAPTTTTTTTTTQTTDAAATMPPAAEHRFVNPSDIKWADAPASLPKGAKIAVLEGDPAAPGPFTMRLMVPAGYKIAPHTHPGMEHVTVISGAFFLAMGDTWDETKGHELTPGSFAYMAAGMKHFAWAKKEAVLQVHGMGPWGITYLNPSDDPRNQKQATK